VENKNSMQQPAKGVPRSKAKQIAANRAAIFIALKAAGVVSAVVNYIGLGDEGGPEDVHLVMPAGSELEKMPTVPWYKASSRDTFELVKRPLDEAITDFGMDAVDQHHSCWAGNDGGGGEIVFDVASSTVCIKHNNNYMASEYSEVQV